MQLKRYLNRRYYLMLINKAQDYRSSALSYYSPQTFSQPLKPFNEQSRVSYSV